MDFVSHQQTFIRQTKRFGSNQQWSVGTDHILHQPTSERSIEKTILLFERIQMARQ